MFTNEIRRRLTELREKRKGATDRGVYETSDVVEWEPTLEIVDPQAYCVHRPSLALMKLGQDPPRNLQGKILWHHLHFHAVDKRRRERFFSMAIRGEIVGRYLHWYRDPADTPDDRVSTLKQQAEVLKALIGRFKKAKVTIRSQIPAPACVCSSLDPNKIELKGRFYVLNTYYLPNFFDLAPEQQDRSDLRTRLDAAESLTACYMLPEIRLANHNFLDRTAFFQSLINDGDRLGIFRKRLHRSRPKVLKHIDDDLVWLQNKVYSYALPDADRSYLDSLNLADSEFIASFARNGIVEVTHESRFSGTIREAMTALLRFSPPKPEGGSRFSRDIAAKFVQHVIEQISSQTVTRVERSIRRHKVTQKWRDSVESNLKRAKTIKPLLHTAPQLARLRERQRYIIIKLTRVICSECDGVVHPAVLAGNRGVSTAFLEGHLTYPYESADATRLPKSSATPQAPEFNRATCADELVLMSYERCLIYSLPKTMLHAGNIVDDDEAYWRCLIRAFQHFLAVKTAIHLLENWTVKITRHIPVMIKAFEDWEKIDQKPKNQKEKVVPTEHAKEQMGRFVKDMEGVAKYLPSVRETSIASSSFRASFVVEKFKYLSESVYHLTDVLKNIQHNIDELNSFLQYFKQRQLVLEQTELRDKVERLGQYVAIMGLLLAILGAFIASPSFVQAFVGLCEEDAWQDCFARPNTHKYGLLFLVGIAVLHALGVALYCWKVARPWKKYVVGTILLWISLGILLSVLGFWTFSIRKGTEQERPQAARPVYMTASPTPVSEPRVAPSETMPETTPLESP